MITKLDETVLRGWLSKLLPTKIVDKIAQGEVGLHIVPNTATAESVIIEAAANGSSSALKFRVKLPTFEFNSLDRPLVQAMIAALHLGRARSCSDEWVTLAEYGKALRIVCPDFDAREFGAVNLTELIQRVQDLEMTADETEKPKLTYKVRLRPVITQKLDQSQPSPNKLTGVVHHLKAGFGFIVPDAGGDNLFFHSTEVLSGFYQLQPGHRVGYELAHSERSLCAIRVLKL